MRNPAIQNDFSYYRRTINRNRINNMYVSKTVSGIYGNHALQVYLLFLCTPKEELFYSFHHISTLSFQKADLPLMVDYII